MLGGDHHISNPLVKAVSHFYNKPVSIVQFDAHNDLYLDYEGDPYSHASPFARIMEVSYYITSSNYSFYHLFNALFYRLVQTCAVNLYNWEFVRLQIITETKYILSFMHLYF